jgi:hypothetical protein
MPQDREGERHSAYSLPCTATKSAKEPALYEVHYDNCGLGQEYNDHRRAAAQAGPFTRGSKGKHDIREQMESLVAKPTALLSTSFIAFLLWDPERAEGWTLFTSVQSYDNQGHC